MMYSPLSDQAILLLESDERVKKVAEFWPRFPMLVASRFREMWLQSEVNRSRAYRRHKEFRSPAFPDMPPPQYLGWEGEVFEIALQECLMDLRATLWKSGLWKERLEDEVLSGMAPSVRLLTAYELSRLGRPELSMPKDSENVVTAISPSKLSGDLNGWYLIGYHETEITEDNGETKGYQTQNTVLGATFGRFPSADQCPLLAMDAEDIWSHVYKDPGNQFSIDSPLVAGSVLEAQAGTSMLLGLAPMYTNQLGLKAGIWPGRLELCDSDGNAAVRFAQWRTNPFSPDYVPGCYRLVGCALFVRPDVMRALESLGASQVTNIIQRY